MALFESDVDALMDYAVARGKRSSLMKAFVAMLLLIVGGFLVGLEGEVMSMAGRDSHIRWECMKDKFHGSTAGIFRIVPLKHECLLRQGEDAGKHVLEFKWNEKEEKCEVITVTEQGLCTSYR